MGNRLLLNIRQTVRDRDGMMLPLPQPAYGARQSTSAMEFMEMEEVGSRQKNL